MTVPASSSGSRKRPASPSLPAADNNPSSKQDGAHSGQATLKRQRVAGSSGRPASADDAAQAGGSSAQAGGSQRVHPRAEGSSNARQQGARETTGESKASRRADKGKGREVHKEPARGGSRPNATAASAAQARNRDSARSGRAALVGAAPPATTAARPSSNATSANAPNGHRQDATLPAENAQNDAPAETNNEDEPGESRETLLAQVQILQRRLDASERVAASQTRVLSGLYERCSCDVCFDLMTRPCIVAPCGHMACRECLVAYWKQPSPGEYPLREGLTEDERQRVERHRTLARKKSCPICRSQCLRPPAEAWLMKNIVGDIERWKSAEDRHATRETIRRTREEEREQERLRQERTNREAGPSTLPGHRSARTQNGNSEPADPAPTVPAIAPVVTQLQERAARLREAEALRKKDASAVTTSSDPVKSANTTTKPPAETEDGATRQASDELDLFPSDDENESEAGPFDGVLAPGGSQASQTEIIESARAQREAGMAEEIWADIFRSEEDRKAMFWDREDGIWRCPACMHEIEHGEYCDQCHIRLRRPEGRFQDNDLEDMRRIQDHRQNNRGWAADSDEDSYLVSQYEPSSPGLEGPWVPHFDNMDSDDDEEEDFFIDDEAHQHAFDPDDLDEEEEEDLSDFIAQDGYDDIEEEDDDEEGILYSMPGMLRRPFLGDDRADDEDEDEDEDEDNEDERLAQRRSAIRAQALARARLPTYDSSTGGEEDGEDDQDAGPPVRVPARFRQHLLSEDEDEDEDDDDGSGTVVRGPSRFRSRLSEEEDEQSDEQHPVADQYLLRDAEEDYVGSEEMENDDLRGEDERAYLYPGYHLDSPDRASDLADLELSPDPEDDFGGQDVGYDDGHGYGDGPAEHLDDRELEYDDDHVDQPVDGEYGYDDEPHAEEPDYDDDSQAEGPSGTDDYHDDHLQNYHLPQDYGHGHAPHAHGYAPSEDEQAYEHQDGEEYDDPSDIDHGAGPVYPHHPSNPYYGEEDDHEEEFEEDHQGYRHNQLGDGNSDYDY
ncbi:hypothetical protein A4X09_0g2185 [Tilletia walkeri]|uniref:RING-type domain-containing protein n=1 Tax=Tilletia walkeri TaxID=117179 RepID=A0A8X7NCW8_9BASI|nr:hypothetical protein A4X09_0g2185 [Tilletia walkeri]